MRFGKSCTATCVTSALLAGGLMFGSLAPVLFAQPPAAKPAAAEVPPQLKAFLSPLEFADGDSELLKKQKERHNAGVALLNARLTEYKSGLREIGPVYDAARLAADAKVDLAPDDAARLTALEQIREIANLFEAAVKKQLDLGFGSAADYERARFARLSVEVEILKFKAAAAPAAAPAE